MQNKKEQLSKRHINVDDFGYLERNGIAESKTKNLDRRYIV